jgi:CubicO group peptidase (beta-lactamase class C family)
MTRGALDRDLSRRLAEAQVANRWPAVSAAASIAGDQRWTGTVATTTDTQFRIGSITKSMTAAVVLLLVDEGSLDLDDRLETYLSDTSLGRATIRQLLAHTGGLPREAATPMWRTFQGPDRTELLDSLKESAPLAAPGARWHYSNLGYALLGEVVARVTDSDCRAVIDQRILQPLGLARTSWIASPPAAAGLRADPYADVVHVEPEMEQGAIGVGGQLWSTGTDLLVWADALLGRRPEVLPLHLVDTMHTVQAIVDGDQWEQSWGVGLLLRRVRGRVVAGHTGAMPGFSSALFVHRDTGVAGVVLVNATRASGTEDLVHDIVDGVLLETPAAEVASWTPTPVPEHLTGVLGRWWSEGDELLITWTGHHLRAALTRDPRSGSLFTEVGPDVYRVTEGRWFGEELRVLRDGREVASLEWATYPFTREPR